MKCEINKYDRWIDCYNEATHTLTFIPQQDKSSAKNGISGFIKTINICEECYNQFIMGIYKSELVDEITTDNVDKVILDEDE